MDNEVSHKNNHFSTFCNSIFKKKENHLNIHWQEDGYIHCATFNQRIRDVKMNKFIEQNNMDDSQT